MAATLTINGQSTAAPIGATIFECAEAVGVRVPTSCNKQGKCKECMVEVAEGMELLGTRTPEEKHLNGRFRLSCRTAVTAGGGEIRCHTMRRGQLRIDLSAEGLPEPLRGVERDPAVTRRGDSICIDGAEIERSNGPIYGIAMDLGTTTVVLRLFNLETGELVADASFENPQRFAGSDVMARIHYDSVHPGKLLRRTLAGYLSHAIEELPVNPKSIYEMVVVGNSTMRDLFFRQSVHSIGQSPYQSITELQMAEGRRTSTSLTETGWRSLLPIHPKARVWGAPVISGHVGADAAACMLAADLANEERLIAIMDIGTNTELIVGNRHRILAASCPAGPAFEGGAIACGMPALDGAVEDVRISEAGEFELDVIGGGKAEGICGSGLVALMSELMRTEQMNERGRFEAGPERIELCADGSVYFTESDVNELAQAKGANSAGLQVVFANYGIDFDQIEVFYLAGGFGRHMDVEAAERIGLIPAVAKGQVVQAGNASIEGASLALLSQSKRRELEQLVRRVEHCRLETHPRFFDFFVEGCLFKPMESARQVAG
jgi:uncharacterized 2Fe-2S/4Fe-4S cluster protein (DUF4445 family)